MRYIFEDGINSSSHVFFGIISYYFSDLIAVVFIFYQVITDLILKANDNYIIDTLEFFIGYVFTCSINLISNLV